MTIQNVLEAMNEAQCIYSPLLLSRSCIALLSSYIVPPPYGRTLVVALFPHDLLYSNMDGVTSVTTPRQRKDSEPLKTQHSCAR